MPTELFGDCLARLVQLSGHDVAEILEDQSASGKRFGEIALAWGLCRPEHVWEAWASQLGQRTQVVDLSRVGIDAQAAAEVPSRIARRLRVVGVRKIGEALVVATDEAGATRAAGKLPKILRKTTHFVVAPAEQIGAALAMYYPALPVESRHRSKRSD